MTDEPVSKPPRSRKKAPIPEAALVTTVAAAASIGRVKRLAKSDEQHHSGDHLGQVWREIGKLQAQNAHRDGEYEALEARVEGLLISTSDTSAVNLAFYVNDTSADHYIGVVDVPAGSGYTTVPRVDGIATIAPAASGALILPAGYILKAACVATMTSAKVTDLVATGGSY